MTEGDEDRPCYVEYKPRNVEGEKENRLRYFEGEEHRPLYVEREEHRPLYVEREGGLTS